MRHSLIDAMYKTGMLVLPSLFHDLTCLNHPSTMSGPVDLKRLHLSRYIRMSNHLPYMDEQVSTSKMLSGLEFLSLLCW